MKVLIKLLMFISSLVGAFTGFIFIILSALNELQDDYIYLLSYFVFFGSLLMLVLSLFYKRRIKLFYTLMLFSLSILHVVIFFTLPITNYLLLIPVGLYLLTSIMTLL